MTDRLPESLRRLVEETLQLAHLDPEDQTAVGRDLADHFKDGLAAGRTVDELAARFGAPAVAAGLIAESRSASRPGGSHRFSKEKRMARFAGSLRADVRYAVRGLVRSPGFTVIAALTLALGIGVNTAIFSVVRATLLSSLPLADSHLLVRPYFRNVARGFNRTSVTYIDLTEWREQTDIFEAVAHYGRIGVDLEGDPPARTFGASVSEDFFKVYRAEPVLGRLFAPEEHVGDQTVVILARSFWESRFGADPDIPGTTIRLSGRSVTVVGVVDETRTWPTYPQFWIPRITPASMTNDMRRRDNFNRSAVARLRDDVSIEQASVRLGEMSARVARDNPVTREGWEADVAGLREWIVGLQLPVTLWVLLAAATFVLLIACTNVASLLATRSAGRRWRWVQVRGRWRATSGLRVC